MANRATWTSKTGFLLAALGSAIGLGNIWRFPYMAYRNGGGAFLVPYFVALFVVGIPLLMLEFGLGHYFRRAFPQSLTHIHPRFGWIGWWAVSFVMFGIVTYYGVVIAWCGNYLVYALTQPWGDVSGVNQFFDAEVTGSIVNGAPFTFYSSGGDGSAAGLRFGQLRWSALLALAIVWVINWLITRRQLHRGVELANKIFIPLLVLLTAIMVVWSWGLDGASDGREVYMSPDWSLVTQPNVWIDAFSQIFFTLSIGFGIMVAYASYLPRRTDIPTSAFLAALGNCAFSVFAGFAVFGAIGMLAHQQDVDLVHILDVEREVARLESLQESDPVGFQRERDRYESLLQENVRNQEFQRQMSTFGLLFKTYPAILTEMGGVTGRVFGVMFFLSLVVAGISSSISIVEAFMAALTDQFGWRRSRISAGLCCIGFVLGIVFCTQAGLFWLDLVDHFITTYGLVIVGLCEALIVGWVFPAKRLRSHLDEHRDFRLGAVFAVAMRLLITAMLLLTWWGLGESQGPQFTGSIARFALLASVLVLWIDEHWLDFDIRLIIPALLIVILDQALVRELRSNYGDYPRAAILTIGAGWFVATLVVGVALSRVPVKTDPDSDGG